MAKSTLYTLGVDCTRESPASITDELYTNVGSSAFQLGDVKRAFLGSTDVVIRTAASGGGTLLVEGTDYEIEEEDFAQTELSGYHVYTAIRITTAGYQTGNLYISYKTIGSYTSSAAMMMINEWATGISYSVGQVVRKNYSIFLCLTAHTSGTFSTDWLTNSYWVAMGEAPGSVKPWPSETVPPGWLECNGASLVRTSYSELFAVISTLYGAADSSHFNLPDLRGVEVRGWDHGRGVDLGAASRITPTATWAGSDKTGATAADGDHVGTEQNDQMQGHIHRNGLALPATTPMAYGGVTTDMPGSASTTVDIAGSTTTYQARTSTPVDNAAGTYGTSRIGTETRNRNVAMMYIIKQ